MTSAGGPKTNGGKLISSKNALKHGLSAKRWLDNNEASMYERLLQDLTSEHEPEGVLENIQLERIANCLVKLQRIHNIETDMYKLSQERAEDPEHYMEGFGFNRKQHHQAYVDFGNALIGLHIPPPGADDYEITYDLQKVDSDAITSFIEIEEQMPALYHHIIDECIKRECSIKTYLTCYTRGRKHIPEIKTKLTFEKRQKNKDTLLKNSSDIKATQLTEYIQALGREIALYKSLETMVTQYHQHKNLMIGSATPRDSDLAKLNKERTAYDRMLSKSMGELLELQERRFKKERQHSRS